MIEMKLKKKRKPIDGEIRIFTLGKVEGRGKEDRLPKEEPEILI